MNRLYIWYPQCESDMGKRGKVEKEISSREECRSCSQHTVIMINKSLIQHTYIITFITSLYKIKTHINLSLQMTMLIPEFAFEIKFYALIKKGNWLQSSNNFLSNHVYSTVFMRGKIAYLSFLSNQFGTFQSVHFYCCKNDDVCSNVMMHNSNTRSCLSLVIMIKAIKRYTYVSFKIL